MICVHQPSHIFLDHGEAEEGCEILDALSPVSERRTAVDAVFVGENVTLDFVGVN